MDRILEPRNIELMRKMILMQEQVFKQQVQELHRVYNHQKKLMEEEEIESKQGANELIEDEEKSGGEVEVDLTLSIGGHNSCCSRIRTKQKSHHYSEGSSSSASGRREERCQDSTPPRALQDHLHLNTR